MVRLSLRKNLAAVLKRLHRPGVGIVLVSTATLLVVVALVGVTAEKDRGARRPSLLDLLNDVGMDKDSGQTIKGEPPVPPKALAWASPLARQCSGIDPNVRERLLKRKRSLAQVRKNIPADPSNFGNRFRRNPWGQPLNPDPRVVVLHETVYSLGSAINTFLTPHPRDEDQVSYHTLIGLDGSIVDLVDPLQRAFGAGYSSFLGEWAVTNAKFQGSVNNFALHLSLETPKDGHDNDKRHSGYTQAQYDAMALVLNDWLDRFGFEPAAITTHQHVDLGGERADPRSFSWSDLQIRLAALGKLCR